MLDPFVSETGEALLPAEARSALGRPVWSREGLLRDLELRLGLASEAAPPALRIQAYAARLASVVASAPLRPFFAVSLEVDPLGTAQTLLVWRDELVLAGWNGEPIGQPRIDALALVESVESPLPFGAADRLRVVEAAISKRSVAPYRSITLLEPEESWPLRWQRVLGALAGRGMKLEELRRPMSSAPVESDLGRLQARLAGRDASSPSGEGSVVLLGAETTSEAAEVVAAWLAESTDLGRIVVLRGPDAGRLDAALFRRGLAPQGSRIQTSARGPLAILPLLIALAVEPKDPALVLDLLSLPLGPFRGKTGRMFADALASWPGLASQAWKDAREKLASDPNEANKLARVAEWIEAKGLPEGPAPKAHWRAVAEKVGSWARGWLSQAEGNAEEAALGAVSHQVSTFTTLLDAVPHEKLDVLEAQHLVELATGGISTTLFPESAGRLDHLDAPGGLFAECDTLVWWGCTDLAVRRPRPSPWRGAERKALSERGIVLLDPAARLRWEAESWRRAVQSVSRRVLLVEPRMVHGEAQGPHPLLDEMAARAGYSKEHLAQVRIATGDFLVRRVPVPPLAPPRGRLEWRISKGAIDFDERRSSVTGLDALLGCPLRWVLEKVVYLRDRGPARLSEGPLLAGNLGHRLVERLHARGAWSLRDEALRVEAERELEQMLADEATSLGLPGQMSEADQLRRQLVQAMVSLGELLDEAELELRAVEEPIELPFLGGTLQGRLDVLLADKQGRERLVDLKWGASSYERLLKEGRATQLAAYAEARRRAHGAPVPAAYFSLASGRAYALDLQAFPGARAVSGRAIDDTWKAAEKTAHVIRDTLHRGGLPVVGADRSKSPPTLLARLGVKEAARESHLELPHDHACHYCSLDALCGRRWPTQEEAP